MTCTLRSLAAVCDTAQCAYMSYYSPELLPTKMFYRDGRMRTLSTEHCGDFSNFNPETNLNLNLNQFREMIPRAQLK